VRYGEGPRWYSRERDLEEDRYDRDWDTPWEPDRAIPSRMRRESAGYGGYGPYGGYGEQGWMGRELGREQERPYYGGGRGPFGQPERGPRGQEWREEMRDMRETREMRGRGEPRWSEPREGLGDKVTRGLRNWLGLGPKGYRRSDDRIREDVCDRLVHLAQHADVDSSDVDVNVKDGEVSLRGTVRERRWKHLVEDVADGVPGVRDVHNQLRVRHERAETEETPEERRGTTGATANNPQDTSTTASTSSPRTSVGNNGPGSRGPSR
jgi:hypothetical protein